MPPSSSLVPGIFAKTFQRPTLGDILDAVVNSGLQCVQFNLACCGLPTVPKEVPEAILRDTQQALQQRGIDVAAVSATFNLIHPDPVQRAEGLSRLPGLARASRALGAPMLTLCTGTRDAADMWRGHPDNASPEAWSDLCRSLEQALHSTEDSGIVFGIEPELSNVVSSAARCRQLLDALRSPRLRVVLDGANLLTPSDLQRQAAIFAEAFDLLGPDIAMAHAKEIDAQGHPTPLGAGSGHLDWTAFFRGLKTIAFRGPLILHGLDEASVPDAVRFLRSQPL